MERKYPTFDISALKKGEKKAYEEIYSEYFGVLYHLCIQYLHHEKIAEEIVQDTFLKLWEIRNTLNEQINIRSFLYTITKNNCLNYLRNQKVSMKHMENIKYLEMHDVYNYTTEVMTALKNAGVTPAWVQVGNEIPGGMIYPEGSVQNWPQLAQLINKGYDAIKTVSPTSKVILHIDQGNDNARFRWWFDAATANGARYDMIGLSYYPYWIEGQPDYTLSIDDLGKNMNDMVTRYGKEVMVVEVGGEDIKAQNTYNMLVAVQNKVKAVTAGFGKGVFYWEPEGARSWSRYALSAWGDDGKPTKALDAFLLP